MRDMGERRKPPSPLPQEATRKGPVGKEERQYQGTHRERSLVRNAAEKQGGRNQETDEALIRAAPGGG